MMELGAAAAVWLLCSIVAYLVVSWVAGLWRLWRDWREAAAQRDLDAWSKAARSSRETREALAEMLRYRATLKPGGAEFHDGTDLAAHADKLLPGHRCPAVGCLTYLDDDRAFCGAHSYLAKGRVTDCAATYPAYGGAIGNGCREIVEGNDWLCARHRKQL